MARAETLASEHRLGFHFHFVNDLVERNPRIVADLTSLAEGWKSLAEELAGAPEPHEKKRRAPAKPRAPRKPRAKSVD